MRPCTVAVVQDGMPVVAIWQRNRRPHSSVHLHNQVVSYWTLLLVRLVFVQGRVQLHENYVNDEPGVRGAGTARGVLKLVRKNPAPSENPTCEQVKEIGNLATHPKRRMNWIDARIRRVS